jgi:hypothetical protein
MPNARTYVNGDLVTDPHPIHTSDRIIFGKHHVFRFINPLQARPARSADQSKPSKLRLGRPSKDAWGDESTVDDESHTHPQHDDQHDQSDSDQDEPVRRPVRKHTRFYLRFMFVCCACI